MSTLVWQPSPRSSASPQPHAMSGPARHQVGFGLNSHAFVSQHASSNSNGNGNGTGGPAGFGFGFGAPSPSASASSLSNGFGFGGSSGGGGGLRSPSSSSHANYTGMPFPSTSSAASSSQRGMTLMGSATPGNNRRRRRSDSAEDMREDTEETSLGTESAAAGKRARREIRPVKSLASLHHHHHHPATSSAGSDSGLGAATSSGVPPSPQNEVDIGKALAGLSKPALLTVLTSLLSQQPALKPLVLSLLPPPSLDSFTTTLNSLERRILDALPSGGATRQEYVWSRIRAPLEEYISETRLALSQFCPSSSPLAAQGVTDDQQQQQQTHPTSTFAFLYTLTLSVRKLEAILPRAPIPFSTPTSAISSTSSSSAAAHPTANINNPSTLNQRDPLVSFLPPLYNQWHHLITKLSTSVNQGGKILSAEMLRGWFRNLDTLVSVESVAAMATANSAASPSAVAIADAGSVGRKASEAVRDRFVKELGWLVGIRQTVAPFATAALSPYRSASTQVMDSRMMGDNGEDTDEEL